MNREFRQHLAHSTLDALAQGFYVTATGPVAIAEAQRAAQAGSQLYRPASCASLSSLPAPQPTCA